MPAIIVLVATMAAQTAPSTSAPLPTTTTAQPTKPRGFGQQSYLDLEGGLGYSTHPRFCRVSGNGSGDGYVSVQAVHARITDRTTTLLSAFAQETFYIRQYGSSQSLSVTARHDAAINERLRLFVDGTAAFDKNGLLDTRIIGIPDVPVLPGSPDVPPQILPSGSDFLAVTGKRYSFSADAGGQLALGPRDNVTFSGGIAHSVFRSGFADTSFWSVPASIGYDRQISPRADVGGRLAFVYSNYDGPGRFWTVTPQLTASLQVSPRMSLNGAVGASFSSVNDGVSTRNSVGLSANATLCNAGEYSRLCARAAIDQTAATVAGPARSITAGVDYSRRLGAYSSIQLSINGSHYSSPVSLVSGPTFSSSDYYRAAAAYSRQFGRRLSGGVNLAARKLVEKGPDPKPDLNASLFIRYRLGDVQ
jgi:hypothetical protein